MLFTGSKKYFIDRDIKIVLRFNGICCISIWQFENLFNCFFTYTKNAPILIMKKNLH